VQLLDLPLTIRRTLAIAALECPCRLIQQLLLPGINLVRMNLIALARSATVACSRSASSAIFALSAPSIFRLVLCVILRSVCCDGTAQNPISQPVRNSGSTSVTASVTVSLDHTRVSGNGTGVVSMNGAAVILNSSSVQANGTGLSATSGGAIFSYGNNPINGNQPGGIGAAPIVIGLH
jgi:hypothetical protein